MSSLGGLEFSPENAPEGSADRCMDRKYVNDCPYSAKRIYIDRWIERVSRGGMAMQKWYPIIRSPKKNFIRVLNGRLRQMRVQMRNNLVDRQYVQMDFENGITLLKWYLPRGGRRIAFYGDYGEMIFDERPNTIEVRKFGKEPEIISVDKLNEAVTVTAAATSDSFRRSTIFSAANLTARRLPNRSKVTLWVSRRKSRESRAANSFRSINRKILRENALKTVDKIPVFNIIDRH
ncbi:MAG: hypothetical protein ACLUSP_05175 [Christensenellales bacterium]